KRAARAIPILFGVNDDADSEDVVQRFEIQLLGLVLSPDRIATFGATLYHSCDSRLREHAPQTFGYAPDAFARLGVEAGETRDDRIAGFRMEFRERQVLHLLAQVLHADATCERRIDVQPLLR